MNNKKAQKPSASVAYQTVIVNIQSQNGKCTIKCRALLDSGSSKSFITQQLVDELQSKAIGPRMRKTFEGLNEKLQEVETEQHLVRMKSLDGKYCTQLVEDPDVAGKSTSGRLTNWRYQKGKTR